MSSRSAMDRIAHVLGTAFGNGRIRAAPPPACRHLHGSDLSEPLVTSHETPPR